MTVTAFHDLPLADRSRRWSGGAAEKRVRAWAAAEDRPNARYRDAHVWYDSAKKDEFTGYKLLIADVVDGELTVVPRAVMAAGGILQGSHGGIDLPRGDIARVRSHLSQYYAKWGETPPWDRS
jgi:hypothetical protein